MTLIFQQTKSNIIPKKNPLRFGIAFFLLFIGSDKIDILFISHFDADHVNGIRTLLDNGISIKYVVMPFLAPEEIKFLLAFYEKIEPAYQDIRTLINTPDYYFGEETIIIKIKPINEIYSDDNNYADISLDNWAENQLTKENGCFCINYNKFGCAKRQKSRFALTL